MADHTRSPAHDRSWFLEPAGLGLLWAGMLAGPAAWALDLSASYALVHWTCSSQLRMVLHLISVLALVLTAGGAAASWTALQRARSDAVEDGPRPMDRGKFMATLGLLIAALFGLVIVSALVPQVMLDACL
jgi:hypothetical protein